MKPISHKFFTAGIALSLLLAGVADNHSSAWAKKKQEAPQEAAAEQNAGEAKSPEAIAVKLYNEGVELFQIAQIQSEKGNESGQKKLLQESIRRFEQALEKNPALVEAQSNIGFAYLTLRDDKDAIKAFDAALKLNPNHLNSLNGLSTAYAFNGNVQQAIDTFDKLTMLDPGNAEFYFNKGSVLQKAGKFEEAKTAYQEALRVNPSYQRALFNVGTLLENQGQLAEAKTYYEKAKGTEIGNLIGLEAIRRIETIEQTMQNNPGPLPSQ